MQRVRERHVRRRKVAVWIARAAIKHAWTSPPALAHAAAFHKFAVMALRALDPHRDRARVLALRIAGTADKRTEASMLLDQVVAAKLALLFQRFVRLESDARTFDEPPRRLAIRVAAARQECSEATALHQHFLAAIFAIFSLTLGVVVEFRRHVLNKVAIRIARAAKEESVPADALQKLAFAALFALLPGRDAGLVRNHLVVGLGQIDDKLFPEFAYGIAPGELALFNFVEFFFEARRKRGVEHIVKALHEQSVYAFTQHRRRKAPLILAHVLTLDNRRNNRGIRRRPANALFFQLFHQRRFGIARRWFREVLVGTNLI